MTKTPWITPEIKTAIKRKHRLYKYVRRSRRLDECENVRACLSLFRFLVDILRPEFDVVGMLPDPSDIQFYFKGKDVSPV